MKTIAVANAKGGTGKSTLTVHLATGLARRNKVLLIDLDPQGNSTASLLGLNETGGSKGSADVLSEEKITREHLVPLKANGGALDLLPATPELMHVDRLLADEIAGETALKRALDASRGEWDYVVIDCPPSLNNAVLNAFCAADGVLVPIVAAYFSLAGVRRVEDVLARLRDRLKVNARTLGYVLFAADPREAITAEVRELLRKEGKDKLFRAEIRVSTKAKSLPGRRATAWDGNDSRGEEDYEGVLAELLRRLGVKAGKVAA